ncbi:histidine kinase [Naegleria gruberi]|uniref:Histidine kinase n=1 Tax=Naegleria gruberi TaxID=5762 RepID=D2W0H4_NAEGR|nr:histidine kinase [Naegleria gruberi]EFC37429.1 histidine kinase [Naegleria gruberi]|eukprot:XP_002670173.1 histidine kinase [Naegleria gruberi strain NEG-M]
MSTDVELQTADSEKNLVGDSFENKDYSKQQHVHEGNEIVMTNVLEETTSSGGMVDLTDQQLPKFEELESTSISDRGSFVNIRTISYSIQIVTNFIMLLIVAGILFSIFFTGFQQLEEHVTTEANLRIQRAIYDDFKNALALLASFGNWLDFYNVMDAAYSDGYKTFLDWVDINYPYGMMRDAIKSNFALIYFKNGTLAAAKGFNLETGDILETPAELANLGSDNPLRKDMDKSTTRVNGYLLTSKYGALLVSAYPIHFSPLKNNPPNGILIFARIQTEQVTSSIASRAQMCITQFSVNDAALDSVRKRMKLDKPTIINGYDMNWENNQAFAYEEIDLRYLSGRVCDSVSVGLEAKGRVATFQLYADIYGNPAVVLRADTERFILNLGINAFVIAVCLLLAIMIILGIAVILFTEVGIIRGILQLTDRVTKIYETSDISNRVSMKGNDEIAKIGSNVDQILTIIENSQVQLKQKQDEMRQLLQRISLEEYKTKSIMNSLPNSVIMVDKTNGEVVGSNEPFYECTGYSESMIKVGNLSVAKLFNKPSTDQLMDEFKELTLNSGSKAMSMSTVNGMIIPVIISVQDAKFYKRNKVVSAFVISIQDKRKDLELVKEVELDEEKVREIQLLIEFERMIKNPDSRDEFIRKCNENGKRLTMLFVEVKNLMAGLNSTNFQYVWESYCQVEESISNFPEFKSAKLEKDLSNQLNLMEMNLKSAIIRNYYNNK